MKTLVEHVRTLLILGRISNLPTVWSNLLAGWFITGQGISSSLTPLIFGGSFLYVGGMYLNDFCDVAFDSQFCHERPIPAGKISRGAVGGLALLWFLIGFACLASLGEMTAGTAVALIAAIVIYDFHHKGVSWAPLLMGFCRLLLYPLAASAAMPLPLPWYVVAAACALGFYVAGITYLARGESRPEKPERWALLFLLLPVIASASLFATRQFYHELCVISCGPLLVWMAWLLIPLWRKTNPSIGRVVSGLLAGIVLVDIIAVSPLLTFQSAWFLILFALALLLQRIIPAT